MTTAYGATPEMWQHFMNQGLTPDLQPVVSNPHAEISENSKMKGLGKTPSSYNSQRKVRGEADWTNKHSTEADVRAWMRERDYGICIQTRRVRALDIDVDDKEKAAAIVSLIRKLLPGVDLPIRARSNSGKCLLALIVEGDMPKRRMTVDGGLIEALCSGQQFIAEGTHPSGVRYEWTPQNPIYQTISKEDFDRVWKMLDMVFATGETFQGSTALRKRGEDLNLEDDVVDYLLEHHETYGFGNQAQLFIPCPWKDGHSSDSGETETAWFPAGTNGYARGHFKCLHASCAGRTDAEFLRVTGYDTRNFMPAPYVEKQPQPINYDVVELSRDGRYEPTLNNVYRCVRDPLLVRMEFKEDRFLHAILVKDRDEDWRPFRDEDVVEVRLRLAQGFAKGRAPSTEDVRDAVRKVASDNSCDMAQDWLSCLKWDGVPRIDRFLVNYFGAEESAYNRAVAAYIWTALAGRVLQPGIQADMMPILKGPQGLGKSTAIKAMVPRAEFYCEMSFHEETNERSRKMRGRMIAEIPELSGMQTRELEAIKAWVTKTHEEWRQLYRENTTVFGRRLLFIGTTNQQEFLNDKTGNRRFLPITVTSVSRGGIERDRDQLWAEGMARFLAGGIEYQAAEALAPAEHDKHVATDVWSEVLAQWLLTPDSLGEPPACDRPFSITEALTKGLGISPRLLRPGDSAKCGEALRGLGYVNKQIKMPDGTRPRMWCKK